LVTAGCKAAGLPLALWVKRGDWPYDAEQDRDGAGATTSRFVVFFVFSPEKLDIYQLNQ
jgi:hypothetical protein